MNWLRWYRLRSFIRSAIWVLPAMGIIAAIFSCKLIFWLDDRVGLKSALDPIATRELLETLAASMFTLIVFISSALLLAIQLASAQLTPRVIPLFFKDRLIKCSLALFVFTFTLSLAVAVRIDVSVPVLAVRIAVYGCLLSLAFFIFLIDRVGKFLRPSGILGAVAAQGRRVIELTYPRKLNASGSAASASVDDLTGEPTRVIGSTRSGVILALDVNGIVALADRYNCLIEMVPQVGEFIATDEPLFRVRNGGADMSPTALHNSVAVGSERTLEQDPAFVFRIIVDIASKGLSPAINDPTTAVLSIDQIHRLLRNVGTRELNEGHVRDSQGRLRLVYRTPDWEDFVQLAVTEIRQFGGSSIQIARRLRAMLENLILTLPVERTPLLKKELVRLQRSADRHFPEAEDRALAEVSDSQGVGGTGGQSTDNRTRERPEQ